MHMALSYLISQSEGANTNEGAQPHLPFLSTYDLPSWRVSRQVFIPSLSPLNRFGQHVQATTSSAVIDDSYTLGSFQKRQPGGQDSPHGSEPRTQITLSRQMRIQDKFHTKTGSICVLEICRFSYDIGTTISKYSCKKNS